MLDFASTLNGWIWSPFLVYLCLGTGLYFSVRSRFVQLRLFKEMLRLMFQKKTDNSGVSSFQALSMTLAGRVGTGNIAGVATAICFGGPGALFWMWVVAFLGASSAFVESTLGQIYKEKIHGEWTGGPAFYIEKAGHNKFFAWLFALSNLAAAGFLCLGVQSNSIALAAEHSFGLNPAITAALVTSLLCFILFGGLKRIANFTTLVVPFMAQVYIVVALIVVFYNVDRIPEVFRMIFSSAFSLDSTFGGIAGMAVSWGVKRGIYSNEAGEGTGPHASSAASVSHPAKQGLVQAFSVYIDTWFVCTATGLMILLSGCYNVVAPSGATLYEGMKGVTAGPVYTQMAVDTVMPGFGAPFITIALFFFAFTTILAYCYQAEVNIKYINRFINKPWLLHVVRVSSAAAVAYGAMKTADVAWMLGDIGIGLMSWINLIAILFLQKPAFAALKDYERQMRLGVEPVFHPSDLGISNAEYWEGDRAERNLEIEANEGIENQPMAQGLRNLIRSFYGKD